MHGNNLKRLVASSLVVALVAATAPALAGAPAATLTGTVYAGDVRTPLRGATVVVTDAGGVRLASEPTGTDGAFTVRSVPAGPCALALTTEAGSFAVATPVTLAPGETRRVHLALKAEGDKEEKKNKKGGIVWTGGSIAGMTAVLVGFVAAAAINVGNESDVAPASPSVPPPSN